VRALDGVDLAIDNGDSPSGSESPTARCAATTNGCGSLDTLSRPPLGRRAANGSRPDATCRQLLLDDGAVAIATGLITAPGIAGFEETALRVPAKLTQVLPNRLRQRVATVTDPGAAVPDDVRPA
jgi:hypothetical protein